MVAPPTPPPLSLSQSTVADNNRDCLADKITISTEMQLDRGEEAQQVSMLVFFDYRLQVRPPRQALPWANTTRANTRCSLQCVADTGKVQDGVSRIPAGCQPAPWEGGVLRR